MSIPTALALFAAVFPLLVGSLHAESRSCRIVFPERPNDAPKFVYLFDGSKSQRVTLPSMNLSEVIALSGGDLAIAMTPKEITDPKTLSPNAPLLRISEKVRDFYIIITPDPTNKELPIQMNLVDTGGGKLKPGDTLWYNFTKHRIVARLGDTKMSVDPSGRTISEKPAPASGYYTAKFGYQANGKGVLAPITEQRWWHDAQSKHLGFMVNSGGKLPKIYYFRDFRNPEPPPETEEP